MEWDDSSLPADAQSRLDQPFSGRNQTVKRIVIALCAVLASQAFAQNPGGEFQAFVNSKEQLRRDLWEKKDFPGAIAIMRETYDAYVRQDSVTRLSYAGLASNLFYNTACAFSLLNQKDSAILYLRAAVSRGYSNYLGTTKDTDFENIRDDQRFIDLLAKLKEVGDYEYLLKKYSEYDPGRQPTPGFVYEPAAALSAFRLKYNLDSIAGNGSELTRIINLMRWTHAIVRHDGNSMNPKDKRADALINICRSENRGVNCRMMATILNEAYLAEGFASRFVTCMPRGEKFDDCHVINVVYSKELRKWVWMDPTFETYVSDDKGTLLSIEEVRNKLIRGEEMVVAPTLNWNGKPYDGGANQYLHVYMAKNLFRFSCPLESTSGFESRKGPRSYVDLYPVGYNPTNVSIGVKPDASIGGTLTLTNPKEFWAQPPGTE